MCVVYNACTASIRARVSLFVFVFFQILSLFIQTDLIIKSRVFRPDNNNNNNQHKSEERPAAHQSLYDIITCACTHYTHAFSSSLYIPNNIIVKENITRRRRCKNNRERERKSSLN